MKRVTRIRSEEKLLPAATLTPVLAPVQSLFSADPPLLAATEPPKSSGLWSVSTLDTAGTALLKILAIVVVAVLLNRVIRLMIRRFVQSLQQVKVQRRLDSIRSKTPRALLANTDPLPSLRRVQRAEAIGSILRNVSSVLVWSLAVIAALTSFGVRIGPLIAGAGIVGLVLSLSAQQMVRDFLSGIAMLVEDQYGPGDVVDTGFAKGEVERVGLRTTRLRAVDGTVWHVRNGEIQRLGNESRDWARVLLDIEVERGTDVRTATNGILAAARSLFSDPEQGWPVLGEPDVWGVEDVSPVAITIRLAVTTRPGARDQVARALRAKIEAALQRAGIAPPSALEGLLAPGRLEPVGEPSRQ